MKHLLLISLLALYGSVARAQLDRILEPIADAPVNASPDQALGDSNNVDMAAVASGSLALKTVRTLSADNLQSELQKQLSAYFGLKGDLRLSFLEQWRPVPLPGKDCDIMLTDYPAEGVTTSFSVTFKVVSGGIAVGEWQLPLRAQLRAASSVASPSIARCSTIEKSTPSEFPRPTFPMISIPRDSIWRRASAPANPSPSRMSLSAPSFTAAISSMSSPPKACSKSA
jgi:hypothetical protein